MNAECVDRWANLFPGLRNADAQLLGEVREITVPAGTTLVRQGEVCGHYLLVAEGAVKVFARAENGREIVLYRIVPGGACILTTSCLMAEAPFPAEAISESELRALVIPAPQFRAGLQQSSAFRTFVFESFGARILDLIHLVEQVAFGRVDVRLARFLLAHGESGVSATHQALAAELGTAREVVSRRLKEFETRGWVALHRGNVAVLDGSQLQRFVETAEAD